MKASEWNKETRKLDCMETIKENYRLHQKKKSKYKGLHKYKGCNQMGLEKKRQALWDF